MATRRRSEDLDPSSTVVDISLQDDFREDNLLKCLGFDYLEYTMFGRPYTAVVRCEKNHPHRTQLRVVTFASGRRETERIPCYGRLVSSSIEGERPILVTREVAQKEITRRQDQFESRAVRAERARRAGAPELFGQQSLELDAPAQVASGMALEPGRGVVQQDGPEPDPDPEPPADDSVPF